MSDDPGVRIADEYVQFKKLREGLKMAEDAARMIAFKRGDPGWTMVSNLIHQVYDKTKIMERKVLIPN